MSEYAKEINVASPAFNAKCSEGDDSIRDLKVALKERLDTDHYWEGEATVEDKIADGKHRKVTMINSNGVPNVVENSIILNCQDSSGRAGIFVKHEDNLNIEILNKQQNVINEVVAANISKNITIKNTRVGEIYKLCFAKADLGVVSYPNYFVSGMYVPVNQDLQTMSFGGQYLFFANFSFPSISNGSVITNLPYGSFPAEGIYKFSATPFNLYQYFVLFKITTPGDSVITITRKRFHSDPRTDLAFTGEMKMSVKKVGIV